MIAVISPAKTLDFENKVEQKSFTVPRLLTQTNRLIRELRLKKSMEVQELMSVSENIAQLNVKRYKDYRREHTVDNSKQSIHAFKGDVYIGLDVDQLDTADIEYAQKHLRILSGLYGLLRPKDIIQPHRLEMGTSLTVGDEPTLYKYWNDRIVKLVHKDLKEQGDKTIVNLASNEYFKSIKRKSLKAHVVDVEFLDLKNGKYKVISFFAKKARGMMARYIIKNRINEIELLKGFDYDGYYFDPQTSTDTHLVFKRDQVPS
ncbi:MAG: peroxide stress protein YaaA [Reichenbachiella sp.]|uniref:peroxide stress protein YaaA n=1 Tax=Reichenbachiella sp. TaxID=2184521 RepID=UPI003298FC00